MLGVCDGAAQPRGAWTHGVAVMVSSNIITTNYEVMHIGNERGVPWCGAKTSYQWTDIAPYYEQFEYYPPGLRWCKRCWPREEEEIR